MDWENYLPLGCKFPISKAKCVKSKLHNEPSVQAISKKAVVKKLQKHFSRPEGVPLQEMGAEFKIEVSILKDVATVMIDTTGSSLFKRGYRVEKGGAPIKENMALLFCNYRIGIQINRLLTLLADRELSVLRRLCWPKI